MKSEKGFSLLEVLVAMALIGIVAVGCLAAMTNATKGAVTIDRIDTARALAQGQMEYAKKLPFAASYNPDPSMVNPTTNEFIDYPGYVASISTGNAAQRDAFIQKITVTITHNGNIATTLDDCKAKR
jgi:prepilin-type N-terminal cleavage/methylation domain-containing protein